LTTPNPDYSTDALPVTNGSTGIRYFCSNQTGVIYVNALSTGISTGGTCSSTVGDVLGQ
jgi:hypothetical protein